MGGKRVEKGLQGGVGWGVREGRGMDNWMLIGVCSNTKNCIPCTLDDSL